MTFLDKDIEVAEILFQAASMADWLADPVGVTNVLIESELELNQKDGLAPPNRLNVSAMMNAYFVAGRWAACGYPTIRIGHGAACGLMATNGSAEDLVEMVRAPWPAFAILLPNDLLWIEGEDRTVEYPAVSLFVTEYEGMWTYALNISDRTHGLWANLIPAKAMWDYQDNLDAGWLAGSLPTNDSDFRTSRLVRRLIAGICLQLSTPEDKESARVGKPASVRNRNRKPGELPATDNYEVRLSVKIDERVVTATREYARHGGRSPTVQSLVRGHWKRQVHGPGRSLRKMIHIAPFWRGPIDAPISMRVGGKPIKGVKEPDSGSSE